MRESQRTFMDKYGVVQEAPTEKVGTEHPVTICPRCGAIIPDFDKTGGILVCEQCGTQPFE